MEQLIPWFLFYVTIVIVFYLAMVVVIVGHLYFAFRQSFRAQFKSIRCISIGCNSHCLEN